MCSSGSNFHRSSVVLLKSPPRTYTRLLWHKFTKLAGLWQQCPFPAGWLHNARCSWGRFRSAVYSTSRSQLSSLIPLMALGGSSAVEVPRLYQNASDISMSTSKTFNNVWGCGAVSSETFLPWFWRYGLQVSWQLLRVFYNSHWKNLPPYIQSKCSFVWFSVTVPVSSKSVCVLPG